MPTMEEKVATVLNPGALTGVNNAIRDYSRVLQFNPVTLEITWQYTPWWLVDIFGLPMRPSFTVPISVLHRGFQ